MIDHTTRYAKAVEFLFSLQWFGTKLGLENTTRLASLVGNPHEGLKFIHVAGTNGKGSTCAMLESIYREQGLRVGLFTSPHLISFCERIQVNRVQIPEEKVVELCDKLKPALASFAPQQHPTFFEVVTIMALLYFEEQKCEIVVWETGMGGRLDATNIVTPMACILTNIQYDHQKWLGNSLSEIAFEKAGILKPGVPAFTAAEGEGLQTVSSEAERIKSPLDCIDIQSARLLLKPFLISLPLHGSHQVLNAGLAVLAAQRLRSQIPVSNESIKAGLARVSWPGRFQVIHRGSQKIILDGAHNPAGSQSLVKTFREDFPGEKATLILGVLKDKDYLEMAQILAPMADRIICCPVNSPRSASPAEVISGLLASTPHSGISFDTAKNLADSLRIAAEAPLVVVTGSLFFIGEAMEFLSGLGSTFSNERGLNEWNAANHPSR
ncbi:MAG: FolC bifunctional protein [Verrucomicrobiales bacterium]|nr:FolC bifunctional protein [Verrucomicrobiales bacterium]